jgi:hypothetical protein
MKNLQTQSDPGISSRSTVLNRDEYLEILEYTRQLVLDKVGSGLDKEMIKDINAFVSYIVNVPDHLFFTPRTIQDIQDAFMGSTILQEFVFSITTSISIFTGLDNYTHNRLIETLTKGVCFGFVNEETAILPDQVKFNLAMDQDTIRVLLSSNFWLVALFLCHSSCKD